MNEKGSEFSVSRRDFIRMKGLATAALLTGCIAAETENTAGFINVSELPTDVGTDYTFSLGSVSNDSEIFTMLKNIEERTKKNTFLISVDHQGDDVFLGMFQETTAALSRAESNDMSLTRRLKSIAREISTTFQRNKLEYYPWFTSEANLESFLTFPPDLGPRMKERFTCYEASVFAKEVLKKQGMQSTINFDGLHSNILYPDPTGAIILEPLNGTAFSANK